jgi:hypothetical protein
MHLLNLFGDAERIRLVSEEEAVEGAVFEHGGYWEWIGNYNEYLN